MAKGKKTCAECGTEFALNAEECPECGTEYCAVFKIGSGEVLIHDKKGEEIALAIETHGGYRLRIHGKPPTFHPNYAYVLKEIRHARVAVSAAAIKSVEELIKVENEANEFIKTIKDAYKMVKRSSVVDDEEE